MEYQNKFSSFFTEKMIDRCWLLRVDFFRVFSILGRIRFHSIPFIMNHDRYCICDVWMPQFQYNCLFSYNASIILISRWGCETKLPNIAYVLHLTQTQTHSTDNTYLLYIKFCFAQPIILYHSNAIYYISCGKKWNGEKIDIPIFICLC